MLIILDGAFGDVDAELEQLAAEPLSTSERVLARQALDQSDGLGIEAACGAAERLPPPKQPKALAMPTQQRRLNDLQDGLPIGDPEREQ